MIESRKSAYYFKNTLSTVVFCILSKISDFGSRPNHRQTACCTTVNFCMQKLPEFIYQIQPANNYSHDAIERYNLSKRCTHKN